MKRGAFLKDAGGGDSSKNLFLSPGHPSGPHAPFCCPQETYLVCGFQALPNLVSFCPELTLHIVSVFLSTW